MTTFPTATSQTVSFLVRRFREAGIRPATRHGQNFLIDGNLQQVIIDTAELDTRDVVLEVGTGTGALSALLADRAAAVVSVEIDRQLFELASEELLGRTNIILLRRDALANKNRFDAEVLDAVAQQVAAQPGRRWKLVANLPFNVATPILSNLLACPSPPTAMIVTIQRELADRIVARPATKDYGALSIWIQSQCSARIVRLLSPTVFWPRPKVTSAIIQVVIDRQRRDRIPDLGYWHQFVRAMFWHRRKFLRRVVLGAFKGRLTKADVDAVFAATGLGPSSRAEQLDIPTMLVLCEAIRSRVPDWHL